MPVYEWTGSSVFHDNRNDRTISPGEQVELSEDVAGGHREFVEVEPTDDSEDESESVAVSEFSGKDWQSMAAAYDGFEDVNGQSSADDIQSAFEDLSSEGQAEAVAAFEGDE